MSAITFDDFLALCDGVVDLGGDRYQALCPCHSDRNPSLHVERGKRVDVVAYCFTCRDAAPFDRIVEALKTGTWANGHKERRPVKRRPLGQCVAQHEYRRADGTYAYDKLRYRYTDADTGEAFKTLLYKRQPPGCDPDETMWGRGDEEPVLYNLPEIAAVEPSRMIVCLEGESDVDAAVTLGLTATCTDGGAWAPGTDPGEKWCKDFEVPLHGREYVVICRDFDEHGLTYAEHWASRLYGKVGCVKVLTLPRLKEKGDFRDWVAAGGTVEQFVRLSNEAPEWKPERKDGGPPPIETLDLARIAVEGIPPVDWIVEGWLARKDVALPAGGAGIGKSTTIADLGVALSSDPEAGRTWLGIKPDRRYRVGVVDEEQSAETVARLYLRLGATPGNIFIASGQDVRLDTDDGAVRLEAWIVDNRLKVVILDGVQQVFGAVERKDAGAVGGVFKRVFRIRDAHGVTFILLAPKRKGYQGGGASENRLEMILDSVAFGTQSDTVWFCEPAGPDSLNLVQVKRRGGTKTSLVALYSEDGDRIRLSSGGTVEASQGAVERCAVWIRTLLSDRDTPTRRNEIVGLGAKVPGPDGPHKERTIDDALKLLIKLGTIEKPKQGWYQPKRQGPLDEGVAS